MGSASGTKPDWDAREGDKVERVVSHRVKREHNTMCPPPGRGILKFGSEALLQARLNLWTVGDKLDTSFSHI